MKVIAIIAAYNEADIIGPVLRALDHEGVLAYLIDNGSTDRTRAVAESFLGHGLLGIERYPAGPPEAGLGRFDWRGLLRRKEDLARTLDADWFVHHDADEFRESAWPNERLVDGIARADAAGYNAIDFELLNFYPADDAWPEAEDPRPLMRRFQAGAPWDKLQIKCWKKTPAVDLVSSGGHEARFEGRRVCPVRFLLRHYPIRSQAHGERKVFVERQPRVDPAERSIGWHVQYDGIAPGHDFLHAAARLPKFDPDRVRMQLTLRHREFEDLETVLTDTMAAIAGFVETPARSLSEQRLHPLTAAAVTTVADGIEALRRHAAEAEAIAMALRNDLAAARQRLADEAERRLFAERSIETLEAAHGKLKAAHEKLEAAHRELRSQRDSLLLSRTWRWTAPVRRIAAWFMGVR